MTPRAPRNPRQKKNSPLLPFIVLGVLAAAGFFGTRFFLEKTTTGEIAPPAAEAAVRELSGKVEIQRLGQPGWQRVPAGFAATAGDKIRTLAESAAELSFFEGSVVRLAGNSELLVVALTSSSAENAVTARLESGQLWARVEKIVNDERRFEIETPTVTARAKGTAFAVETGKELRRGENDSSEEFRESRILVFEGTVAAAATERVEKEDDDGFRVFEVKTLAEATLPAGSALTVDSADLKGFREDPLRKPAIRVLPPTEKNSLWVQENLAADRAHLERLREEAALTVAVAEEKGFFARLLRPGAEKEEEKAARARTLLIDAQLEALEKDLKIPSAARSENSAEEGEETVPAVQKEEAPAVQKEAEEKVAGRTHIVQPGDTLFLIAQRYGGGLTVDALIRANELANPNFLQVGQELVIPFDLENLPALPRALVQPGIIRTPSAAPSSSPGTTAVSSQESFESATPEPSASGNSASSSASSAAPVAGSSSSSSGGTTRVVEEEDFVSR